MGLTPAVFEGVQGAIASAVSRAGLKLIHPAQINRAGAVMRGHVEPEIEQADVVLALIKNPNVCSSWGSPAAMRSRLVPALG